MIQSIIFPGLQTLYVQSNFYENLFIYLFLRLGEPVVHVVYNFKRLFTVIFALFSLVYYLLSL